VSGGSTLLPYGAVVGISRAALFKSESDVFNAGLQWNGKPIDGNIVRGEYQLSELIIPTTQQINFAIAHELVHVKHLDFIPQSLLPPSLIIVFYQLGRALKSYFPMRNTIVLVPAVLMFSVLMMNVPSVLCHWQEYRADREAALCGVTYTEGGIITMKKRMLLDHWLGNKPKSFLFDNEAYPPLEKRLDQLKDIYNKQR
jgi:Zn-dependent protease with chaperone function